MRLCRYVGCYLVACVASSSESSSRLPKECAHFAMNCGDSIKSNAYAMGFICILPVFVRPKKNIYCVSFDFSISFFRFILFLYLFHVSLARAIIAHLLIYMFFSLLYSSSFAYFSSVIVVAIGSEESSKLIKSFIHLFVCHFESTLLMMAYSNKPFTF